MEEVGNIDSLARLSGKYLTLMLSDEQYGLPILKVVEIFGMMNITRVPRCPEYVKGVINLRGRIIPVIDLRLKFNLDEKEHDRETCIVVVHVSLDEEELTLGMIVDNVIEVRDFDERTLAPAPTYSSGLDTHFITAMGTHEDGSVTILLDIDKIFEAQESEVLVPLMEEDASSE